MRTYFTLLLTFAIFYSTPSYSCTDSKDPRSVVQAQVEAYNRHDIELFASCFSSDVKIYDLGSSSPSTQGIDALKKEYQFLNKVPKDFKAVIEKRMVHGPIVIDYERITGRQKGKEDILVFAIYEVRDGKIKNVWFPPSK